jgi:hypothetical protein
MPCPPDGAVPVSPAEITVNVFNTSQVTGLASETATALHDNFGFVIGDKKDSDRKTTQPRVTFGLHGTAQAYTLHAYIPDSVLVYDDTRDDATINLYIGSEGAPLVQTAPLAPDTPLVGLEGCTPFGSLATPVP